jgi:arsenate reductase
MAEGIINHDFGGLVIAKSAGVMPGRVSKRAIKVLDEIGIDISHHWSKHISEFQDDSFDLVITLCDYAHSVCPVWPKEGEIVHIGFEDPYGTVGSEEDILSAYRKCRDDLRKRIGEFLKQKLGE